MQEKERFPAYFHPLVHEVGVRVLATCRWMSVCCRPQSLFAGEGQGTELAEKCHVQFNLCQLLALATKLKVVIKGELFTTGSATVEGASAGTGEK